MPDCIMGATPKMANYKVCYNTRSKVKIIHQGHILDTAKDLATLRQTNNNMPA